MTPFQRAKDWYRDHLPDRDFNVDLFSHLLHGNVLSTPRVFALVRAVPRDADPDDISDPAIWWDESEADAWFVWLLVGPLHEAVRYFPHPKPWVAFARNEVLRFHPLSDLIRRSINCSHANHHDPPEDCPSPLVATPNRRRRRPEAVGAAE